VIQVKVKCPHCGKSLMEEKTKIDEHPSVRVIIEHKKKKGELLLSSLYGSYNIQSQLDVPKGEVVDFFCPHCNTNLKTGRVCGDCQAPMVGMNFFQGGRVLICSRKGCKKHLIEFEDLDKELLAFYNAYPLFFRG